MAEENLNPLITSPVEQVEDAYIDAYESFVPIEYTEEDVYEQVRTSDSAEDATNKFATTIVDGLRLGYNLPEVSLESLKDGTSPFYKYLREKTADRNADGDIITETALDEKGFGDDRNILNYFSNLSFKDNPELEGLFNQIGPAAAFSLAFAKSAQSIYRAAPGSPFTKLLFAGLGSVPIGFLSSSAVDYVQENIFDPVEFNILNSKIRVFGEEIPAQPEDRARYLSGKAFADFISFMPMPWLVKKGTKMGAASVLSHLRERAKMIENADIVYKAPTKKGFFGTAKPTPLGKDFQTYMQTGKFPMTRRLSTYIDNLITGGLEFARNKPVPYLLTEAGFAGGATVGARVAEESSPGSFLPRFGAETGLGFTGALGTGSVAYPVTRIFFGATKAAYNTLTKGRPTDKPLSEVFGGAKDTVTKLRQRAGVKGFLNFLEKYGVDSEQFVKKLDNAYMGLDKKFLEEFNLDVAALEKLAKQSVGFKSGEPLAILYESSLMSNTEHLGPKRQQMFEAAEKATLNLLKILRGSGNDEGVKLAAQIEGEMLQNKISTDLDAAINNALIAFTTLKGGRRVTETGGFSFGEQKFGEDISGATNTELSEMLFNVLENQFKIARKTERDFYEKVKDFEIGNTFDGQTPMTTPRFLAAFDDNNVIPQDKDIKAKYLSLPGYKDALNLYNRLRAQLGLVNQVDTAATSKLETEMQDLVKSFDKTVLGQKKNNLSKEIEDINNRIRDYDNDVDFAEQALSYLNSNKPTRIDTSRKGFTLDQKAGIKEAFNQRSATHKAAVNYYKKYLKQAKLSIKGDADDPEFEPVTYQTLVTFRSELLDEARNLRSKNPRSKKATGLSLLAESIRDDLTQLGADPNAGTALQDANRYSFAMNNVFTRSVMGRSVLVKERTGELSTPPELLFRKIQALDDATAYRYKELENIHNFLKENNIIEDVNFKDTPTYGNILYHLVRNNKMLQGLVSNKSIKTSAGEEKDIKILAEKSAKNLLESPQVAEMMKFFPDLKIDLQDSIKKQSLLDIALDADGAFLKSLHEQGSLSKILEYDDPSDYIRELLNTKKPISNLQNALNELRAFTKNNPDSQSLKFTKEISTIDGQTRKVQSTLNKENLDNGFKEAILTHVLTKSGMNQGGKFSPQKAYSMLFDILKGTGGRSRSSLAMWMKNSGLITEKQLNLFKEVLMSMAKIDVQLKGGNLDLSEFNAFQTFAVGTLGSLIGTTSQRTMGKLVPGLSDQAGPGSIIAAKQGADLSRKVLLAIPESLRQSAMVKVMNDPQLFLQLNKELKEGAPINYFGALLGALQRAGLIGSSITLKQLIPVLKQDEDEGKPGFSDFIKQKLKIEKFDQEKDDLTASVDLPKEGFPTTQRAIAPPSGLNTRLAANVGAAPQAAPNLNQRQQFASLFPNDPISGLINAQQPPRLMRFGGEASGEFSDTDSLSVSDMGLETDLAAQEQVQGGLDPYGDTGRNYSTDVQKALYNPQGFQKGRKTDYMKKMLSLGLADRVQKDASGKITGIFSGKSPSYMEQFQMDPLGTTLKAVVPGAGIVDLLAGLINPNREVYTGYNPPNVQTKENLNNGDNEGIVSLRPREEFQQVKKVINPMDIYLSDPQRYSLFGR